jgi:glycosyltransferase involved in cell wall biosynthesis
MRIAAVVHNGVKHDARVLKGAASLRAQGHDVRLFGLTPEESEDFTLPNGIPVHLQHRDLSDVKARIGREELPKGRESSIWTSFRIQGETVFESVRASFEPDIVHMHDHLTLTAASLYKEAFDCPLVWDAHEIYEDLASIEQERATVNSRIIGDNVRYVDGFITLNQSIADFYREKYPELPEAVLVPNAVERVAQTRYDGRLHEAAGLHPDQKILLFQGGYSPHRGIPALLEASKHLREDWSLIFMGWGKLDEEIRKHAEATSNRPEGRPRVAMVPSAPHAELLSWTAGASLGTIPYENTGLNHLFCSPNKLWEYPAAGVPILATDMPEMQKQISKYDIGLTVSRELDPEEMAAAVNSLTDGDLERLKANCAAYAVAENWQNYESRLRDLYMTLARKHGIVTEDPDLAPPSSPETTPARDSIWRRIITYFSRG